MRRRLKLAELFDELVRFETEWFTRDWRRGAAAINHFWAGLARD